jgi:hypothetical protein
VPSGNAGGNTITPGESDEAAAAELSAVVELIESVLSSAIPGFLKQSSRQE